MIISLILFLCAVTMSSAMQFGQAAANRNYLEKLHHECTQIIMEYKKDIKELLAHEPAIKELIQDCRSGGRQGIEFEEAALSCIIHHAKDCLADLEKLEHQKNMRKVTQEIRALNRAIDQ